MLHSETPILSDDASHRPGKVLQILDKLLIHEFNLFSLGKRAKREFKMLNQRIINGEDDVATPRGNV